MTLRERVADWISGGALSRADKEIDFWYGETLKWVDRHHDYIARNRPTKDTPDA